MITEALSWIESPLQQHQHAKFIKIYGEITGYTLGQNSN
ncbi:hypothetical protein imdm_1092 [gamma proteobacterium IMCC2047]|nr:hypothetical protein imdm_1092 [gamma proteobacterium IMCC2047]